MSAFPARAVGAVESSESSAAGGYRIVRPAKSATDPAVEPFYSFLVPAPDGTEWLQFGSEDDKNTLKTRFKLRRFRGKKPPKTMDLVFITGPAPEGILKNVRQKEYSDSTGIVKDSGGDMPGSSIVDIEWTDFDEDAWKRQVKIRSWMRVLHGRGPAGDLFMLFQVPDSMAADMFEDLWVPMRDSLRFGA